MANKLDFSLSRVRMELTPNNVTCKCFSCFEQMFCFLYVTELLFLFVKYRRNPTLYILSTNRRLLLYASPIALSLGID